MKEVSKMVLGVLSVWAAVGVVGIPAASAGEEVRMVFHVEGMR